MSGKSEWKRLDSMDCFQESPGKSVKMKCFVKSGLATRDIGLIDELRLRNVSDIKVSDGIIELIPDIHQHEYRVTEYGRRYLGIRRK